MLVFDLSVPAQGRNCDHLNVKISMDGKRRFKDNIFIERLWRTLKYERIYLRVYETGTELAKDMITWFP